MNNKKYDFNIVHLQNIKKSFETKTGVILNKEKAIGTPKPIKRTLLIAAACIIALGASVVFAAQYFHWDEKLANYFKATDVQQENLKGSIDSPGISVTNNNITVNVVQTLSDGRNIYVVYEILLPEDMVFNDKMHFEHEVFNTPVGTRYKTISQEENKRTVLLQMISTEQLESQTISISLSNFCEYVSDASTGISTEKVIFEGDWNLQWNFDANTNTDTITVEPNVEVTAFVKDEQKEKTVTIDNILISPLSVNIECHNKNGVNNGDHLFNANIVVNMKDGSIIDWSKSVDKNIGADNGKGQMLFYFDHIVDIDGIESITIGDKTLPIMR